MFLMFLEYSLLCFVVYKVLDFIIHYRIHGDYHQKHVLITGCDSGFGKAAATKLDSKGLNVIAACYTEPGETLLKKQCSSR